ncbi:Type I phosphodiesterase / nucleotide pyrophosphatase [Saccharicrinis carchari]|uniref:Type I phosphodiesterase / nucleotide pyrophosphatase n=1 Tax=Saccharicrinis carchari TaxID=1168039 RepID=A0A521D1Y1_SACCC|nr:alkaline phosphatase family protein [Saccharicrinis carchari]SMO65684.1 Type I phosphodiesterase / nucleotide pyrophosphatase [Saccharicrinis carchari]
MNRKIYAIILMFGLLSTISLAGNKKVLILGIDGCRPDALLAANTPNIDKLWQNGAYSFTTQTDEISSSGICWTGMLTGVWHDKHKVVSNAYKNPNIEEYPHFFRRIKAQYPDLTTASIVNWKPIHNILQEGDADIQKRRLFDWWVTCKAKRTVKKQNLDVLFVALDAVDHAGHVNGFSLDSSKYLKQIEKADKQLGKIIKALKTRKNYQNEDWLVIVTTDHGGSAYGHGKNIPEHTTIFYIAHGPSVSKGKIMEDVNVVDVAVTALHHLGVEVREEWQLDGKSAGLK